MMWPNCRFYFCFLAFYNIPWDSFFIDDLQAKNNIECHDDDADILAFIESAHEAKKILIFKNDIVHIKDLQCTRNINRVYLLFEFKRVSG